MVIYNFKAVTAFFLVYNMAWLIIHLYWVLFGTGSQYFL